MGSGDRGPALLCLKKETGGVDMIGSVTLGTFVTSLVELE